MLPPVDRPQAVLFAHLALAESLINLFAGLNLRPAAEPSPETVGPSFSALFLSPTNNL